MSADGPRVRPVPDVDHDAPTRQVYNYDAYVEAHPYPLAYGAEDIAAAGAETVLAVNYAPAPAAPAPAKRSAREAAVWAAVIALGALVVVLGVILAGRSASPTASPEVIAPEAALVPAAPVPVPARTLAPNASRPPQVERYIALLESHTIRINRSDLGSVETMGHQVCDVVEREGRAVAIHKVSADNQLRHPENPLSWTQSTALVDDSITVYCPQYAAK